MAVRSNQQLNMIFCLNQVKMPQRIWLASMKSYNMGKRLTSLRRSWCVAWELAFFNAWRVALKVSRAVCSSDFSFWMSPNPSFWISSAYFQINRTTRQQKIRMWSAHIFDIIISNIPESIKKKTQSFISRSAYSSTFENGQAVRMAEKLFNWKGRVNCGRDGWLQWNAFTSLFLALFCMRNTGFKILRHDGWIRCEFAGVVRL